MEIMLDDLKPEVQEEVLKYLGITDTKEGNYDIIPLFVLDEAEKE